MFHKDRFACAIARFAFFSLAAVTMLAISALAVEADPITFNGSTQGSFNGGAFSPTTSMNGLTFTGASFTAVADEFGRPFFNGPRFIVGYFSVGNSVGFASTDRFNLQLTFNPAGGISPNPVISTASFGVSGDTNVLPVNFDNAGGGIPFTFSNGTFTGAGRLGIFTEFNLQPGDTNVPVYGSIFFTSIDPPFPTPEPGTLAMLGMGLAGVAGGAWRRLRARR
jgi:hypothetical protein